MISIVDYGLGNVQAIANIYNRLEFPVVFARTAEDLEGATRIVLPGVGAFDWAMARLIDSGMRPTLDRLVQDEKVPVIGICVGMQMMATRSDEGHTKGLGWLDADVRRFDRATMPPRTQLPHMGWNDVEPAKPDPLFDQLETDARFYFLHSYYFASRNPGDNLAFANYGSRFTCAVRHENVMGVQFHPEKSHHWGIQLLKNFAQA